MSTPTPSPTSLPLWAAALLVPAALVLSQVVFTHEIGQLDTMALKPSRSLGAARATLAEVAARDAALATADAATVHDLPDAARLSRALDAARAAAVADHPEDAATLTAAFDAFARSDADLELRERGRIAASSRFDKAWFERTSAVDRLLEDVVTIADLLDRTPHAPAADRAVLRALTGLHAVDALHHQVATADARELGRLAGVELPDRAATIDAALAELSGTAPARLAAAVGSIDAGWRALRADIGDDAEAPDLLSWLRSEALAEARAAAAAREALRASRTDLTRTISAVEAYDQARAARVVHEAHLSVWGSGLLSAAVLGLVAWTITSLRRQLAAAEALAASRAPAPLPVIIMPEADLAPPLPQGLQSERAIVRVDPSPQSAQSGYTSSQASGASSSTSQSEAPNAATHEPAAAGS